MVTVASIQSFSLVVMYVSSMAVYSSSSKLMSMVCTKLASNTLPSAASALLTRAAVLASAAPVSAALELSSAVDDAQALATMATARARAAIVLRVELGEVEGVCEIMISAKSARPRTNRDPAVSLLRVAEK